jgi:hypothetical protein
MIKVDSMMLGRKISGVEVGFRLNVIGQYRGVLLTGKILLPCLRCSTIRAGNS